MIETDFTAFSPPDIPSKWDIIPVHSSDRGSFKRCRRYWDWNSPARQNLTLRADVLGISIPLWFGTGIHYCLEQYYNPALKRDPVEVWKTWFDIQWRGGVVTEEWLPRVYDLKPQNISQQTADILGENKRQQGIRPDGSVTDLYKVRGLEDILPDPDHEEFDELFALGTHMMDFYKEYAEKNDDFDILMVEHDFSIPIWDFKNDCILKMRDMREDSPNFEKELEVHARGRMDGIWQSLGKIGIIDHKTAAKVEDNYFDKLETDEQITNYLYAAQVEANYYGLPWKGQPFEKLIYNVLRKAYPKPPTVLQSGLFSVNRTEESTTYEILTNWIAKNLPGVALSEKQQLYLDYLRDVGDEQFIIRRPGRRNQAQLASAGQRLYLEAMDMLDPEVSIYPHMTNDWLCFGCQFRAPCLAKDDGGDWESLIANNYSSNKDR